MRISIFTCIFLLFSLISSAQISIAEARNADNGEIVTIEGIILNGEEGGQLRYIQDETAGIALFDGLAGSISVQSLQAGDKVIIQGEKAIYQGLVELNKILSVDYQSPNNPLPSPKVISLDELGQKFQSERVQVKCAKINTSFTFFSNGNYEISNQSNSTAVNMLIDANSDVVGTSIPEESVEIIGINSFANEVALILLNENELVEKECLGFSKIPSPINIGKSEVEFSWTTTEDANHDIYFGDDPEDMYLYDQLSDQSEVNITFEGLDAGIIYYTQVIVDNGSDNINSTIIAFATQSNSTGEMEVYFNNNVDESFSDGSSPNGDTPGSFDARMFQLLDEAEETIDVAMYNINRTIIVNYLIDAFNRGVRIRYIADDQTSNSAFNTVTPPFGLVFGSEGNPLMHNKFVIIDAGIPDQSKVIMGSMNFTSNQMSTDPNHMVIIHDQSLARAYTLEFEEMWGSQTEIPDISLARFGSDKLDNTPHIFNINGITVESYFSPSDRLTSKIEKEIRTAENRIDIGLLTLTKNELGTAIRDQHENDIDIRLILENFDDTGSEYDFLLGEGLPIKVHNFNPIYHHKLAIFDEGDDRATLLTGSHNWTNKAEFENDENTLIIRDQSIANIFRQEYEARWNQLATDIVEQDYNVSVYPNPTSHFLKLISDRNIEQYSIYDMRGRLMITSRAVPHLIDFNEYSAGSYMLKFESKDQIIQKLIIKQ